MVCLEDLELRVLELMTRVSMLEDEVEQIQRFLKPITGFFKAEPLPDFTAEPEEEEQNG